MPGLFSRYGALGNPIVDLLGAASIAASAKQAGLQAQKAALAPDVQSTLFANAAFQKGEMVDQAPRAPGLFNTLGVKLGMLNPTVGPRAKDISAELEALGNRRKQQEETISKEVSWLKDVGYKNFKNMEDLPAIQQMTMFATGGAKDLGIEGPTVREQAIDAVNAQREFTRRADMIRLGLATDELDMRHAQWARKQQEPIPGTPAYYKMESDVTAARTAAREAVLSKEDASSWGFWHRHHPQQSFVDSDFNLIDESKLTPGQAMADHVHYKLLLNAQQQNLANTAKSQIDDLTDLRDRILPEVFVKGGGKSNATVEAEKLGNWMWEKTGGRFSDSMSEFNKVGSAAMGYAKMIQGRYGTNRDVEYIREGNMPNIRTETLEQAQARVDRLIRSMKIAGGFAVDRASIVTGKVAADTDFFKDIAPMTPPAGTEVEKGSVVPPMPPEPSGIAGLAGIIGDIPSDVERGEEGTP